MREARAEYGLATSWGMNRDVCDPSGEYGRGVHCASAMETSVSSKDLIAY